MLKIIKISKSNPFLSVPQIDHPVALWEMSQQVLELVTIHKNHRWTAGEPPTKNRRLLLSLSPERPERSFTNIFRSPFKMWSLYLGSKSHSKSSHFYELTRKSLGFWFFFNREYGIDIVFLSSYYWMAFLLFNHLNRLD